MYYIAKNRQINIEKTLAQLLHYTAQNHHSFHICSNPLNFLWRVMKSLFPKLSTVIKLKQCEIVSTSPHPILNRPVLYSKFRYQKGSKAIQRIPLKAYKNIFRADANGESTLDTLNSIQKSSSLKVLRNLEFDP